MAAPRPGTDWQLGCMELKQRGSYLLQSGQWSDCSFLVGSDNNRATIKAHKLILACASPVFEAMFFGGMAEKDAPIEIIDVQPEAFETLLQYIYTDKAAINSFEKACSVYYGAKKYMLPYLEKECIRYLSFNLNPQNVCRAFELAQLFDEKLLMEKCVKILTISTKEVINDSSFEDADISTLLTLLSQDNLNIESELDLFRALEKYANLQPCRKRRMENNEKEIPSHSPSKKSRRDSIEIRDALIKMFETSQEAKDKEYKSEGKHSETVPSPEETEKIQKQQAGPVVAAKESQDISFDANNNNEAYDANAVATARATLRGAICKIRFLTLSAVQFAGGPARSALLSESEAFAVLMNIISCQAHVPLPHGFSTCRVSRNQQTVCQEKPDSISEVLFRFTVLNLKTRRRSVESRSFTFLDMAWTVKLVPRFETDTSGVETKYFGIFVKCLGPTEGGAFTASVHARVRLVPYDPARAPICADLRRTFNKSDNVFGFERFVTWADAMDPARGIVKGNALTIETHLTSE